MIFVSSNLTSDLHLAVMAIAQLPASRSHFPASYAARIFRWHG